MTLELYRQSTQLFREVILEKDRQIGRLRARLAQLQGNQQIIQDLRLQREAQVEEISRLRAQLSNCRCNSAPITSKKEVKIEGGYYGDILPQIKKVDSSVTDLSVKQLNWRRMYWWRNYNDDDDDVVRWMPQIGAEFSRFKQLRSFTFSFNHQLFENKRYDNLVNSLNGLESLKEVKVCVGSNTIRQENWTQRLRKGIKVTVTKD